MGLEAELLATGVFNKKLAWNLEYPESYYNSVPEGSEIITYVFDCNTTDSSEELAYALGIDPWALGCHKIDLRKVDYKALAEWCIDHGEKHWWPRFTMLKDAAFTFWYRPNG